MKQLKKFDYIYLENNFDYSISDLVKKVQELPEEKRSLVIDTKVISDVTYEYGEYSTDLRIDFYRYETDEEEKVRLKEEEFERDRAEKLKEQRQLKSQQKAEKKLKEQQVLNSDPDYQKFLELQKKFKKK